MARVTPKTNWVASDTPVAPDFNRIEGNSQQAFDELDTEASTRSSADSTLQSNINAEASTRASADSSLQSQINAEASTRASADSSLQSQINTKATKAVVGDNGGVGSIVTIGSTWSGPTTPIYHTWTFPRYGLWFYAYENVYVNGSSYTTVINSVGSISRTFWQIG